MAGQLREIVQTLNDKILQLQANEQDLTAKRGELQTIARDLILQMKNTDYIIKVKQDIVYLLEIDSDSMGPSEEVLDSEIGGSDTQKFIQYTYKCYYDSMDRFFEILLRRSNQHIDFHRVAMYLFAMHRSINPTDVDITISELLEKINKMTKINKLCIKLVAKEKTKIPINHPLNELYDRMIKQLIDQENIMQEDLVDRRNGMIEYMDIPENITATLSMEQIIEMYESYE